MFSGTRPNKKPSEATSSLPAPSERPSSCVCVCVCVTSLRVWRFRRRVVKCRASGMVPTGQPMGAESIDGHTELPGGGGFRV